MRWRAGLAGLVAAPWLMAAGSADPPSAQTIIAMMPSVVRIVSAGCGKDNLEHVGTGFIWPGPGDVVTDLHLLVGCSGLTTVTFITADKQKSAALAASVTHVLVSRDLALLHVANPPAGAKPLAIDVIPPRADDQVKVYGYPRGIGEPDDKRLAVSVQTETFPQLSSSLDQEARDQLIQLKFPRLDTEVVHLDGALSPGHSGAPIINGAGEVVGVGSGGLQQGAAGISWAVRTEYLKELLTQGADLPAAPSPTGALYAMLEAPAQAEKAEPDIPSITCGELTLTRQGAQTLSQLVNTSADRARIERIARQALHINLDEAGAKRYEIWSEPSSGVAIAVPPDAQLVSSPPGAAPAATGFCTTEHKSHPKLYNVVRVLRLPGNTTSPEWQFKLQTNQWMQLQLMSRLAGAGLSGVPGHEQPWRMNEVINGAWVGRFLWGAAAKPDGTPNEHQVVILRSDLAGRGAYVMVAALARMALDQMDPADHNAWAQGVMAAYLSTFPPLVHDTTAPAPNTPAAEADKQGAADAPPAEVPPDFTVLRTFPAVQCGWSPLVRLSPVTSVGQAWLDAGNPQELAEAVVQASGLRPSALAAGQFDLWGQTASGLGLFLPRGLAFSVMPGIKMPGAPALVGNGQVCEAAKSSDPDIRFVAYSLGNRNLGNGETAIRQGLEAALGAPVVEGAADGGLRSFTASTADGHRLRVWLAAAERNYVVTALALVERDPPPLSELQKKRAVLLAEDLTAVGLSLHVPDLAGTQ